MRQRPEELNLKDSYKFKVTVENGGHRFAGELNLSPDGCSLEVCGDMSGERSADFDWREVDEIACSGFEGVFLLRGLRGRGGGWRSLQRYPEPVSHFDVEYDVSHVIFGRNFDSRRAKFIGVDIRSPSIAKWVGYTKVQDLIVEKHRIGTLFRYGGDPYMEFVQSIDQFGGVAIVYSPTEMYSVDEFSTGLQFPPILSIGFSEPKTAADVISVVGEINTLFSFLFGSNLDIDRINLTTPDGRRSPLSLYSPRKQKEAVNGRYPFFPLGLNLRFDHLGLPSLPTELFSTYFGFFKNGRSIFDKYIKYRSLENPEERFLGFFRLLEKLCFQKESFLPEEMLTSFLDRARPLIVRHFDDKKNVQRFLERVPSWNNSKLNTAGCIARFLKTIPSDLKRKWVYGASDVNEICKLRNDLTHANEAEPKAEDIEKKAKFVEVLLVVRLLIEVGVSVEDAAIVAPRLPGHFMIEHPPEMRFSKNRE